MSISLHNRYEYELLIGLAFLKIYIIQHASKLLKHMQLWYKVGDLQSTIQEVLKITTLGWTPVRIAKVFFFILSKDLMHLG